MSSVVPDGWEVTPLGEMTDVINGRAYKLTEWEDFGVPVIRLQNLTQKGGSFYYSNLKLPEKQYCQQGDLLFMWSASFGPYIWWGNKAIFHYHIWKMVPHETKLNKTFLYFYLSQKTQEWKTNTSGMAMQHLTKSGIEAQELITPPLPEQNKIASILTSVDEVIENIQKQIDKLQDLKKATMNELLTKGIGHTDFKDSELGRIPKSWEVVSLGQLAEVIDPQPDHRTPPSVDFGVPYVGMADVGLEGKIDFENARSVSATVLEEQIDRFDINSGAFLIGKIGTIGNASVLPEKRFYCLSANIILVSSKDISVQRFIYQVFKGAIIEKQIQDQTNTTSQPALGIKKVRDFLIPMPAKDERALIVSILSAIDEGSAVNKQKLSQIQSLKKSLMQDLLTGKVRVTVN